MGNMNYKNYEKDGEEFARITSVLSYFKSQDLVDWICAKGKAESNRVKKVAMGIGTNVDEAIKADILAEKAVKLKTQEAKTCFEAWKDWMRDHAPIHGTMKIGVPLFDYELKVAGTPDILIYREVIDVKCSSEIRPEYWLQTEFYARQLGYSHKSILRLDKNLGIYEYKKMPVNDEHWEAVCGLIKAYRYFNKSDKVGKKEEVNAITYDKE